MGTSLPQVAFVMHIAPVVNTYQTTDALTVLKDAVDAPDLPFALIAILIATSVTLTKHARDVRVGFNTKMVGAKCHADPTSTTVIRQHVQIAWHIAKLAPLPHLVRGVLPAFSSKTEGVKCRAGRTSTT